MINNSSIGIVFDNDSFDKNIIAAKPIYKDSAEDYTLVTGDDDFQILASEGTVYHERDHSWHLGLADRLAAAAPELITALKETAG